MRNLLTVLFIFLIHISLAGTIYVSTTGNDATGDGSIGNPYASLNKASTVATSGDVIYFETGSYTEANQINIGTGVSIDGAGRDLVTITSGYFNTGGGAYDYWINLQSATENTNGNQFIRNITFDGNNIQCYRGIFIKARSNVSIYNCRIKNFFLAGVYWKGSLQAYGTEPINYSVNNVFYDNIVDNCSNRRYPDSVTVNGSGGGLLWISGQQTMLIHDNLLSDTSRESGHNGNIIFSVEGNLKDFKYYNNTSWMDTSYHSYGFHCALEFWNDRGGMEFYNNTFYGGGNTIDQGGSVQIKGVYAYSFWIHNNTMIRLVRKTDLGQQNDGGWIGEGNVNDAIFEYNRVVNYGENVATVGIGYTPDTVAQNNYIQYNLFENMGYDNGQSAYGIQISMNRQATNVNDTIQNIYIYQNTFLNNTGLGKIAGNIMMKNDTTLNLIKNIFIKNNIIDDAGSYGYLTFYETQIAGDSHGGFIDSIMVDHNIIYNNGNSNNAFYRGSGSSGRNTTNTKLYETNSIHSDPLLDSYFVPTFPTSPALQAGANIGYPFTGTAPDIGAFGYVTSNAGADQTIYSPTSYTTVGGSGYGGLEFEWTDVTVGGSSAMITNPTSISTSITNLTPGVYTFQLAEKSGLTVAYDTVVITVVNNSNSLKLRGNWKFKNL